MEVITAFINETPEPTSDTITRIPPDVYIALKSLITCGDRCANGTLIPEETLLNMELMEGIDVYAYSSMITYVYARYSEFPNTTFTYCRTLLANYMDALTSINKAVMYLLIRATDRTIIDKFRRIVVANWTNTNTLFRQTILPEIESSTIIDETIHLELVELSFRARYPY